MNSVKIIKCTCEHLFQDKTYGNQLRVHNLKGDAGGTLKFNKYTCTVCSNEKEAGASQQEIQIKAGK